MHKIRLGVNIDHIATLRQVRGGTTAYPDLYWAMKEVVAGGAQQITIHLREDRRHIQPKDVQLLCKKRLVPINLEIAASPAMLAVAKKHRPDWCCLVPEKRQELTTEGGLNIVKREQGVSKIVRQLEASKINTSLFIDPSINQVRAAQRVGAQAVEFHTGRWVLSRGEVKKKQWKRLHLAAREAHALGLKVHAGHGLDYSSAAKVKKLAYLEELNIGHSLVCYSVFFGLRKAVREMKKILRA